MELLIFIPQSSRRLTGNWREVDGFGNDWPGICEWFGLFGSVKPMIGSEMCETSAGLTSVDARTEHSLM